MSRSRHVDALLATVARDFICAIGEGYGKAIAVTYRELITVRARLLRRPLVRRYRLSDIVSVQLFRGYSVDRLMIELDGPHAPQLMVLFGHHTATNDLEGLLATIERLSRPERISEHARSRAVRSQRSRRAAFGALNNLALESS
jgi:hypothetical protein